MEKFEHGGNLLQVAQQTGQDLQSLIDFSANINPCGPPAWLRACCARALNDIGHYPEPYAQSLCRQAALYFGLQPNQVLAGNGSSELLYLIPRIFKGKKAVIPVPCYVDYIRSCELAELEIEYIYLQAANDFILNLSDLEKKLSQNSLVFIGQPSNPCGQICDIKSLQRLALCYPDSIFVVDEAFADFIPGLDRAANNFPANMLILWSMTKFYALPGLRIGLALAKDNIISMLNSLLPPWTVNSIAQVSGKRALEDKKYVQESLESLKIWKNSLLKELQKFTDLYILPGQANFILIRIETKIMTAIKLAELLLSQNIIIRTCDNYLGLDEYYFRIAVRTPAENDKLIQALGCFLFRKPDAKIRTKNKPVPAIMFQGTSSNAGKSVLAAALCRIFLQDGLNVAPFKSQNMSLNSFVTRDGGEMGRAQVLQAQACRLDPQVLMNPVLMKPNSDTGAQIIVNGQPVGCMGVAEYIKYKPKAFAAAKQAYEQLSFGRDVMVLEGAGSPAEINLKAHDIVNMNMARFAQARVLLVGDIDRGGVFASFIGTMETMLPWERELVAGFVINRFRGRQDLLSPAMDYVFDFCGQPTLGIVPFINELGLPEEDSVSFKEIKYNSAKSETDIRIAVIDFPHISNFTDIDPLYLEQGVVLDIVRDNEQLGLPDVIILPGSRNVFADLEFLHTSGLGESIKSLATQGVEIIGICGGLQMLGQKIFDPLGLESGKLHKPVLLELLGLSTQMAEQKVLRQVHGFWDKNKLKVKGYEIHHGRTQIVESDTRAHIQDSKGRILGYSGAEGQVWGTYLHGIFDSDEFRHWFINRLRKNKHLPPQKLTVYDLEPGLERLADIVRNSLDMSQIYKMIGL